MVDLLFEPDMDEIIKDGKVITVFERIIQKLIQFNKPQGCCE
jgi:hypothetical protein